MSELGPMSFGKKEEQIFLGREIAQHRDYSEDTAIRIDQQVKRFVDDQLRPCAHAVLEKHRPALDRIAEELLAREVLDAEQVRGIVAAPAARDKPAAALPGRRPMTPRAASAKERPTIVSPLPPLNKPLAQE